MGEESAAGMATTETKGIDLSLVEHHLRLSYEERIEAHESARQLVDDLQEAGRQYRANQSQTAA